MHVRIALPPAIAANAFHGLDPLAGIVELTGVTMGTTWRVKLAHSHIPAPMIHARISARLAALVAELSHWDTRSLLSRFNHAAPGTWVRLPPDFAAIITAGLRIAAQSDGAFDPAIGALVNLWGFGPMPVSTPPAGAALAAARTCSGWRRLVYKPAACRLQQPGGLELDLSGIAKGYAVGAVAGLLHAAGVRHHLVEVGGELAGHGVRPDGDPWWVELENPPGIALAPLRIALHGLAVATSGDYRRGPHTIDPRTGRPVANGVVAASVIHADAMVADAWASALMVLGAEQAMVVGSRFQIVARIITREGDSVVERLTPALVAMLAD